MGVGIASRNADPHSDNTYSETSLKYHFYKETTIVYLYSIIFSYKINFNFSLLKDHHFLSPSRKDHFSVQKYEYIPLLREILTIHFSPENRFSELYFLRPIKSSPPPLSPLEGKIWFLCIITFNNTVVTEEKLILLGKVLLSPLLEFNQVKGSCEVAMKFYIFFKR